MLRKLRYKLWLSTAMLHGLCYCIWLVFRYGTTKAQALLDVELSAQRKLNQNRYNKMKANYEYN